MNIKARIINFTSLLHIFLLLDVSNHKVKAFLSTLQHNSRSITSTSRQQRQFQDSSSENHNQNIATYQKITAKQQFSPNQITACEEERDDDPLDVIYINPTKTCTRRSSIESLISSSSLLGGLLFVLPASSCAKVPPPGSNKRKCADIDSCRELGDAKIVSDEILNPTYKLPNGVRYKVLQSNISPTTATTTTTTTTTAGKNTVQDNSIVDMIYSISTAGGQYMYSQGFGYEKVDVFQTNGGSNIKGGDLSGSNKPKNDLGLDSLRVVMGRHDVPVGVEEALLGMKRGERRRVNVPSGVIVGFESSDWRPEPKTNNGKLAVRAYRKVLEGNGSSQPPFPISTVWDVEVLGIRK